jgi:benzoyl-CoA-dihydrodiol lyase
MVDDRASRRLACPRCRCSACCRAPAGSPASPTSASVRRDLADMFCSTSEGVRGQKREGQWRLVDRQWPSRQVFAAKRFSERALQLAALSDRATADGARRRVASARAARGSRPTHCTTAHVDGRDQPRRAHGERSPSRAPAGRPAAASITAIHAAGDAWWPLAMARELEDAILIAAYQRTRSSGTWLLIRTRGRHRGITTALDAMILKRMQGDWFVNATTIGPCCAGRSARLDVSRRARLFALIDQGSCFTGTLLELALACDRSYHAGCCPTTRSTEAPKHRAVSACQFRAPPDRSAARPGWRCRFCGEAPAVEAARAIDRPTSWALMLAFATGPGHLRNPDDIDWADEVRHRDRGTREPRSAPTR